MSQSAENKNLRIPLPLLVWLVSFILVTVAIALITLAQHFVPPQNLFWGRILLTSFAVASVPLLFWMYFRWAVQRWGAWSGVAVGIAILATAVAGFYTDENWRGKRAWEHCKRELEAKGAVLDWDKFIPPPVPDDQNIFKAPKMAEWFVGRSGSDLSKRIQSTNYNLTISVIQATNLIATAEAATNYLAWSGQFEPDFNLIREALKRPYARMDGDYSQPYEILPNIIAVQAVTRVLAQRAHCYLLLNEPEKALDELTLLNDSRRLLEGAPTGKPTALIAAIVNSVTGLIYANTIADGLRKSAWQEPQLAALQNQLEQIKVPAFVVQAFDCETAATTQTLESTPRAKLRDFSPRWKWALMPQMESDLIPRGWIYQNMATSARLIFQQTEGYDPVDDLIQPRKLGDLTRELRAIATPYKFIAAGVIPDFTKGWQTIAYNQTMVNEAQIVCALERYRLAHGEYPETLDTLVPQFIEKLPHDIIGGQPLHYRRTTDGKFLLYSVGWNETDDGGLDGGNDFTKGDWVWKN